MMRDNSTFDFIALDAALLRARIVSRAEPREDAIDREQWDRLCGSVGIECSTAARVVLGSGWITRGGTRATGGPVGLRTLVLGVFALGVLLCGIVGRDVFLTRAPVIERAAERTFATNPGQRATVRLADGSTVLLAPATSLTVMGDHLHLDGEAFFTIAPTASRLVTVHTRNAIVHVLGTTFAVRQYADEGQSHVVVEQGRVTVQRSRMSNASERPNAASAVLRARMLGIVSDSGISITPDISTREYTGWTRGVLTFHNAPLHEVLAELSRAYGTTIQVSDSTLAMRRLVLEVSLDRHSLAGILEQIAFAVNAHYTVQGHTVVVSPGRRSNDGSPQQRLPQPQSEKSYGR